MRVAHLNYFPYFVAGLDKKIKEQALSAKQLGINIDFYVLNLDFDATDKNVIYIKTKNASFLKRKLFRFKVIEENFDFNSYDIVILRYPMTTDFSSSSFIRKYGSKIISEHHTDEISELRLDRGLFSRLKVYLEQYNSREYLNNVKAIIGVTDEIRTLECAKTKFPKNSFVFSNGIQVATIPISKRIEFLDELNVIFVASVFTKWQGLDRVLNGLVKYSANCKIQMKLIGKIPHEYGILLEKLKENTNVSLVMKHHVQSNEMADEYDNQHLAIGTLTQFRTNMQESCPLKVREYIATGLPFVYSYNDSDLEGNEYFSLKVDANDAPLDFELLIDFVRKLNSIDNLQVDMRRFANERLDWGGKVESLYKFAKSLQH